MPELLSPIRIGSLDLKHRVVMAPMTRYRSTKSHVPLDMVADYYAQRATTPGTLIVSEGTFISSQAGGFSCAPGIYNQDQIKAWKKITDAVHEKGSYIFCQLWALGRAAHPEVLAEEGNTLVSSSNIPISDDSPIPEPLTEEGIQTFIGYYTTAAKNAIEGGFDGVEVHGANGYLADQFLQDKCNNRTDEWGGSIEKRARFCIEVAKSIASAIGPEKVGYRISPFSPFQGMKMDDPIPQFSYLIKHLKDLKLAYLHIVESRIAGAGDIEGSEQVDPLLDIWGDEGAIILAGGFKPKSAMEALTRHGKENIAIGFGRWFLANPDLPYRISKDLPLTQYNRATFYVEQSPVGYTDYPFSSTFPETSVKA